MHSRLIMIKPCTLLKGLRLSQTLHVNNTLVPLCHGSQQLSAPPLTGTRLTTEKAYKSQILAIDLQICETNGAF